MANLKFVKFVTSNRIKRAADNAPPMKPGEPDRIAVTILQEALIQAGFPISDGATGFYGRQTAAAVREVERRHGLSIDSGEAGHQVITKLDALLAGQNPLPVVRAANLQLLLQQTNTLGGFTHSSYFAKAERLLGNFGLGLNIVNRRVPEFEFPGTVDPSNGSDIASVRALAERHTPAMANALRIIFCRFPQTAHRYFASTEGGVHPLEGGMRVPDFVLIDVGKRKRDDCVLLHEMIHATGLEAHDPDETSVFSEGHNRTVLKPEHAERLSNAFFARL
jgi:peptidoglycan hydrolase-like protein with peptidoglycan-binding domain